MRLCVLLLTVLPMLQAAPVADAHTLNPSATNALAAIGFSQHTGTPIPSDLPFTDETGAQLHLGDYFRTSQPLILTLNDLHCANLCPLELDGLINGLNGTPFTLGTQFTLLTVALNPTDTPDDAALTRARGLRAYVHPEGAQGWHVLTGDHATIDRLASAVGFDYAYDPVNHDFAHPAGVVVLTPQGVISRYLYGFDFSANDLRLALVDAAGDRIGSLVDRIALVCYHYDPVTGRYTPLVMQVLQIAAAATVLALGAGLFVLWRSAPLNTSTPREPRR